MADFWDQVLDEASSSKSTSFWDGILDEVAGKVEKTPDGRSVAPGTTKEQAADIPPGMVFDPRTGGYVDTALAAERMGKGQGANANYLADTPFIGEYVDEAMGKVDQFLTGRNPEIAQETFRQSRAQFQESNPKTAAAAGILGGIVGSLPLVGPAVGVVSKAPGVLGKSIAGGIAGAAGGGMEGAVSGYGRGTTPENRRSQAGFGGAVGAGLGAALGTAAPVATATLKAAWRRARGLDVGRIADEFGISKDSAKVLRRYLQEEDFDAARQRLASLGDDAMLADAGLSTSQALDTVTQTGGAALRTGKEAVEGRASAVGRRLDGTLDATLGSPKGIKAQARDISTRTATARQNAYDTAFSKAIDYSADSGRAIEGVLARVPRKTLMEAIGEANASMQEAGKRNLQILADIADDGSVTFREMPNVEQLDQIKRALDDIGRRGVDQFGRPTAEGLRAKRLAKDLREAVKTAVPSYERALRLGGDKIAEDDALDLGRRLLTRNVTVEDAREATKGISAEAKLAAKRGLREHIEETLSNVRRTITDPDTDSREAMQLVKDLSSRANQTKLRLILGDRDAGRLLREIEKTGQALELKSVLATNSKTAIRQAGQDVMNEVSQPGVVGRAARGEFAQSGQKMLQVLTGATDEAAVARRAKVAREVAEVLTQMRGPEAQRALLFIERAMSGQPMRDAEAKYVSNFVVSPAFLALYQSGQQALARQ